MSRFITFPIATDTRDLIQRAFDYLRIKIPGWEPSEGQLDVWLLEAAGIEAADVATLASQVPTAIFRYFGQTILRIPPLDSAPAHTTSTWFFTDVLPHVIQAGTQVGIRDSRGNLIPFTVAVDVDIAGGPGQTTVGQVLLIAAVDGTLANGLSAVGGNIEMIDTLAWIDHITQASSTSGGVDAETDDEYLDRLSLELRTMSDTPILPEDFAILITKIAGIQRAGVLDLYNPADSTFGNEKMITLFPVDVNGQPVAVGLKTQAQQYLDSMREVNFVVNIADPTMNRITVDTNILAEEGYDESDVDLRTTQAIVDFLNPAKWGIAAADDPNDPVTLEQIPVLYVYELVSAINAVPGVRRITSLAFGIFGGAQGAVDVALAGAFPLPYTNPGDVTVTVTLP